MYNHYNEGFVEVICGPMYASKTETLISRVTSLQYANKSIRIFKPKIDSRYDKSQIVSHAGSTIESEPVQSSSEIFDKLFTVMKELPDAVIIDEVQFFDDGIVDLINTLAKLGIRVIVAGLDTDFRGEAFPITAKLMAVAEIVTKLTAVCVVCGDAATLSQRLVDGKPASYNDSTIQVGGVDSYEARCRKCHKVEGVDDESNT